jgi:hypothetical protein
MAGRSKTLRRLPKNTRKSGDSMSNFTPAAQQWRIDTTTTVILASAAGLILYDSWVSYNGFEKLGIGYQSSIVFAVLIAVVQLGVGANHVVGGSFSIKGDNGDDLIDTIFSVGIRSIYIIDIASNAVEFGIGKALKLSNLQADPANALGVAAIFAGLAFLLSFGDDMLLRLNDRIAAGSTLNRIRSKYFYQNAAAHMTYLKAENNAQTQKARLDGQRTGQQWIFGKDLDGSHQMHGDTRRHTR